MAYIDFKQPLDIKELNGMKHYVAKEFCINVEDVTERMARAICLSYGVTVFIYALGVKQVRISAISKPLANDFKRALENVDCQVKEIVISH